MLDGLSTLFDGLAPAADGVSGVAALVALLAFLTEFVKGRSDTRSFRPVIGWSVAIVGAFALVVAIYALQHNGLSPLRADGRGLGVVLMVSVLLVVAGVLTAVLTPSVDRSALSELASAVEAFVQRCDTDDRFVRSNRVPLELDVSHDFAWSGSTQTSRARDLGAVRLPIASVAVLAGPTGSGKSVELRSHVIAICRHAKQSRRPQELAVYVSVRMLTRIEDKITQDTITEQLSEAVRQDNSELGRKLLSYLNGQPGPRWFFAFDLDGELTRDQEEAYFQAVRNFMRHRERDRAVIAVRRRFPDAQPVCTPRVPSPRQVRDMLRVQDIVDPTGDIPREIATNPAMIMQFGAPARPLEAVLDAFVLQSLRHNSMGEPVESLRAQAESVAFGLVFGANDEHHPDRQMEPLLRAGLGRVEHGSFAFRFDVLRVHLAAAHLVHQNPPVQLARLCQDDESRAVLLTALRCGGAEFQERLLMLVEQWIDKHLAIPQELDTTLPPAFKFTWPPTLFHALAVLRDAIDEGMSLQLSARLTFAVDHFVWLGVFGGSRSDRESSLALLSLASQQRVLDLYRQAVALGIFDVRTDSLIALHIRRTSEVSDHLTLQERALMLGNALAEWTSGQFLPRTQEPDKSGVLLTMLRGALATTLASASLISAGFAFLSLSSETLTGRLLTLGLALGFALFAWELRGEPHTVEGPAVRLVFWTLGLGGLVAAIALLTSVVALVAGALSRDIGAVASALFWLWLFSWPVAMLAQVVHDPSQERRWLFPQRIVLALPAYRAELTQLKRAVVRETSYLRSPKRLVALCALVAVIASLTYDLPIPGETEIGVDGTIGMAAGFVIIGILVHTPRKPSTDAAEVIGRHIVDGTMTSELLLSELASRAERGSEKVTQLLRMLAAAPHGALASAVDVLSSFENLLEFLERTMPTPANTKSTIGVIKPGLWLYVPASCARPVIDWAVLFDKGHSGFLWRLSHSEKDRRLLSDAIKAATS
jgi:hypothetical protein